MRRNACFPIEQYPADSSGAGTHHYSLASSKALTKDKFLDGDVEEVRNNVSEWDNHSVPRARTLAANVIDRRNLLKFAGCTVLSYPLIDSKLASGTDRSSENPLGEDGTRVRAAQDYAHNMRPFGGRLASSASKLVRVDQESIHFDVVVVGSGYGAGVAAARLSQKLMPGKRICLLERGQEWAPGSFSSTWVPDSSLYRLHGSSTADEVETPYRLHGGSDVVFCDSNGLGGASLIDFGDLARPNSDVFRQESWPSALRDRALIDAYFDLAELELGANPWGGQRSVQALRLERAVTRLRARGAQLQPSVVAITKGRVDSELPVLNRQGLLQRNCTSCGKCSLGCNVGAKNTLCMNYLVMARRAGTEIFVRTEVESIEKIVDHYRIHFTQVLEDDMGNRTHRPGCLSCRVLVLGAGSVGTPEILMKSASNNLAFSKRLGNGWSLNGETLASIRFPDARNDYAARSERTADRLHGPAIQMLLTYPDRNREEGATSIQLGNFEELRTILSQFQPLANHTSDTILVALGHDDARGRISIRENGRIDIAWPEGASDLNRQRILGEMARLAEAAGGRLIHSPSNVLVSTNSIGGCTMSDSPAHGVTNHKGQVYDTIFGGDIDPATSEHRVHDGLYVCDSSLIPSSLGCSSQLTVAALAERISQLITLETKYADLFRL